MRAINQIETEMLQARKDWSIAQQKAWGLRAPKAFYESHRRYLLALDLSQAAWGVFKTLESELENAKNSRQ